MHQLWSLRWKVLLFILILIPFGLLTKLYTGPGQVWVNHSLGGVLYEVFWCLVIFWVWPRIQYFRIAFLVFIITCVLEFMQLWHPRILEWARLSFIGRALLGTTFTWLDFPHYIIGSILGGYLLYWLQKMYDISREASDAFAYNSQMRAKAAMDAGYFIDEITPITIPATRKTPEVIFDVDEHPRGDTTLEGLAKLPPAFSADGTVTAGNASGRNDGSAFVLMMSADKATELGYEPMAKWICGADCGCDPKIMGIAPGYAMPMAIKRAGLKLSDMDVMECNEAFAVQNLAVVKEIENQTGEKVDMEKWNPMGGAIAFGHPNGASGARVCMFAMRHLIRTGGTYGVFASCCGGGLGVATVIENLQR